MKETTNSNWLYVSETPDHMANKTTKQLTTVVVLCDVVLLITQVEVEQCNRRLQFKIQFLLSAH